MKTQTPPPAAPRQAVAFTLIELMTVITVMTILFIYLVAQYFSDNPSARVETIATMKKLQAILVEYQATTGVPITVYSDLGGINWSQEQYVNDVFKVGMHANPPTGINLPVPYLRIDDPMERFIHAALQLPSTRQMVMALGYGKVLTDAEIPNSEAEARYGSLFSSTPPPNFATGYAGDGFMEVMDGWKNNNNFSSVTGNKNTMRYMERAGPDLSETVIFKPYPSPFFVSAGPDGDFGDVRAVTTTTTYKATLDNVYSYELE